MSGTYGCKATALICTVAEQFIFSCLKKRTLLKVDIVKFNHFSCDKYSFKHPVDYHEFSVQQQ